MAKIELPDTPDQEHEHLVDLIDKTLRDDGWLGHTDELMEWHLNAMANAIARAVREDRAEGTRRKVNDDDS